MKSAFPCLYGSGGSRGRDRKPVVLQALCRRDRGCRTRKCVVQLCRRIEQPSGEKSCVWAAQTCGERCPVTLLRDRTRRTHRRVGEMQMLLVTAPFRTKCQQMVYRCNYGTSKTNHLREMQVEPLKLMEFYCFEGEADMSKKLLQNFYV